ncbi:MAG: site-specific DNA-methyltransferase [Anaerolineales bacterium]|nr:site-specific DNA-methyltransferase [Anaerolineales bacterium]
MMRYELHHGDCLDIMPTLAAGSVDAVIADIPYFDIVNHEWDKQWATIEDYQAWVQSWAVELRRITKSNGSIYIFGDDKFSAYVQVVLDKHFLLLNNLVWFKTNNLPIKNVYGLRTWAAMTERILFYTPQACRTGWETIKLDVGNFQPLRDYFREYQQAIGLGIKQINEELGHRRAEHGFYWGSTQWDLPTAETYAELGKRFNTNGFVRREYEDLRREYEDLRRTWNTDGNTLDVIVGNIVTNKENTAHPTTKPIWLMEKLIKTSTNENDTVLDFTMGSGTTGVACMRTGRNFIGIELDADYYAIAQERIANAAGDFTTTAKERERGMMSLFDWREGRDD